MFCHSGCSNRSISVFGVFCRLSARTNRQFVRPSVVWLLVHSGCRSGRLVPSLPLLFGPSGCLAIDLSVSGRSLLGRVCPVRVWCIQTCLFSVVRFFRLSLVSLSPSLFWSSILRPPSVIRPIPAGLSGSVASPSLSICFFVCATVVSSY